MRINIANLLVGLGIVALLAYGIWSIDGELKTYVGVGSFASLFVTLIPAIGFDYALIRNARVLRVVCAVFFALGLVMNVLFASFGHSSSAYVVTVAVSLLVFVFLGNSLYNARQ